VNERDASLDTERWELIEEICFEAMRRGGGAREAFLEARCGRDVDLRGRVEALLRASERHPDFLERPMVMIGRADSIPSVDARIGPYRIVRPIGHGGMGDVYLATLEGDGFDRTVALKVIRRGLDTEQVLQRFRLERRILASLRHPNIAQLVDGGATPDGRPYFVMEYVEGEAIDAYCASRGLPLRERIELVRTVCAAVQHAHQNLVLHRDIKPSNVLVRREGVPVLLDFGVGKLLTDDPHSEDVAGQNPVTRIEERALTPEYAAPEQVTGGAVTTATDVYQLGVLLRRLVSADSDRLPRELDAIVSMATRPEPGERYAGASALSEDLGRFLEGRPIHARHPGPVYVARKFVSRHRWPVGALAVVTAALVVGTTYTWRQSLRVAAERDKALEVRGFLLESFGAAGADRAAGDTVTARALLDAQAALLPGAYADDPELQVEMMTVLAEGYERLGLLTEAETWARRVVDRQTGADAVERAGGQALLGWIAHQQGRSQEALELLEEAAVTAEAQGQDQRTLARVLNDLGVVQEALGDYDAASASHARALQLRTRVHGPDHRSVGVSASNLSAIHYRNGDLAGAVREAERALRILRASLGPDHQRPIIVQSNLAVFKLVQGDLAGAERDYRDLWARQARLQGSAHPVTVRVMSSLATVLRRQEKWSEAEEVLRESVRRLESVDDPNPSDLGWTLATLGDVVSARGGLGEALTLLDRALALQVPLLGPSHVEVAQSYGYLSSVYERADSLAHALTWQERVVSALEESLGADHDRTASERARLTALRERAAPRR
jgi:eukaryotic-like serine/threonine-protein kinase